MAKNYTIKEAVEIIVEGKDLEAIMDLGRRYPILTAKVAALGAVAGNKFVEFMGYMPEYLTANKVNTVIKNGVQESDGEEIEEEEVEEAAEPKAKAKNKAAAKVSEGEGTDYNKMNGDTLIKMCKDAGIYKRGMKKADLVEAMENYDANGGAPVDEEEETDANLYEGKSAMELFKECKKRGIKAEPKKPAKFYASLLTKDDAKADETEEAEDDGWDEAEEEEVPKVKVPAKGKAKPAAKPAKKEAEEDEDWDI